MDYAWSRSVQETRQSIDRQQVVVIFAEDKTSYQRILITLIGCPHCCNMELRTPGAVP